MSAHQCSECGATIGLMADNKGKPELFKCPKTGRVAKTHLIVPRVTPKYRQPTDDVLPTKKKKKATVPDYQEPEWFN